MESWYVDKVFGGMLVPDSNDPGYYNTYIVIRQPDVVHSLSGDKQEKIVSSVDQLNNKAVYIWTSANIKISNEEMEWSMAKTLLEDTGLIWLFHGVKQQKPQLKIAKLQEDRKVELPFVPEFAHDIDRAAKLVDGDSDDVMPITAEFVPTLNCVFRCQQCSYKIHKIACGVWAGSFNSDPRFHMQQDIVKPLIMRLAEADVKYMVVTGGGEPLYNPHVTIMALKAAYDNGIQAGLYSNGALLKKFVKEILDQKPRFVRISVNAGSDSVHKEYHRPLRKQGYFQDVKEGVELLAERKIRSNSATEVGLSYIVNDVNWHDIENFAKWVAETVERISSNERSISPGINFVRFTPTIDYFAHNQYPQHFFDEALHLAYEKAIPLLESVGVQATFFTQRFKNINDTKEYEECLGSSWFAEVSPDGSLYVCCEMNFLPGYWIGDLLRNSIATILESEHRKQVLERLKEGRLRACPVFCKPHTINRIINRIRKAIRHNKESKEIILQWLKDLNSLHEQPSDDFFMKQKTVAF